MADRISGTREWAVKNVNCVNGCEHNCRYCYARWNAVERFHRIEEGAWENPQVREKDVRKQYGKIDGQIMFPTTHDITPTILEPCMEVLENLLRPGNQVLVVSKPHIDCIQTICDKFTAYRDQILFRFTIGAMFDHILRYWEPGAPCFAERVASLVYAWKHGYQTSVSVEPMLDAPNVVTMFHCLKPVVTHSIWIGKMNKIDQRVKVETSEDEAFVKLTKWNQRNQVIEEIYHQLKNEPLVRWKESIKEVLGLELATEAGLDE